MPVRITTDPHEFAEEAFPFLERDPLRYTVLLTNTADRVAGRVDDSGHYAIVCDSAGVVRGAAIRTERRGIVLAAVAEADAVAVARAYAKLLPGVSFADGPVQVAASFVREWKRLTGRSFRLSGTTRLFELGNVHAPQVVGSARVAARDDFELCASWYAAAMKELGETDAAGAAEVVSTRMNEGRIWLWCNDTEPVCFASHQVPVFASTRIGPVYTPPEFRRHGYASALTATLAAELRDRGTQPCLFTDLANPTSNKIYAEIGFRPVTDFTRYAFT